MNKVNKIVKFAGKKEPQIVWDSISNFFDENSELIDNYELCDPLNVHDMDIAAMYYNTDGFNEKFIDFLHKEKNIGEFNTRIDGEIYYIIKFKEFLKHDLESGYKRWLINSFISLLSEFGIYFWLED